MNMRLLNNGSVLYNESGSCYLINNTATNILSLFKTPLTFQEVCEASTLPEKMLTELLIWALEFKVLRAIDECNPNTIINNPSIISNAPKAPITATIYPSYWCNQKCTFCYTDSSSKLTKTIPLGINNWIRIIDGLISSHVVSITILGGEPFAHWNELIQLLEYCNNKIFVRIFTNGTANGGITVSHAQELSKYKNVEIVFSIHSSSKEKHDSLVNRVGSYDTLFQSASNVLKYTQMFVSANTCVTKDNVAELPDIALRLSNAGFMSYDIRAFTTSKRVSNFHDVAPSPIQLAQNIAATDRLLKSINSNLCFSYSPRYAIDYYLANKQKIFWGLFDLMAGGCDNEREINIDSDGYVYRCPLVLGKKEYAAFNILDKLDTLPIEWDDFKWEYARTSNWIPDSTCSKCEFLDTCRGGCPYMAQIVYGSSDFGDPYCYRNYLGHAPLQPHCK